MFPPKNYGNSPFDETEESITDTELQSLLEDRMKVFNNLTAAQIKTQAYDAALKSVENVLACQPLNIKALFRKGNINYNFIKIVSIYIEFKFRCYNLNDFMH